MTQLQTNGYRSPLFSDGDLLSRATSFRMEHEKLLDRIEQLEKEGGCISEIILLCDRSESIAKEISHVLDALEENGYVCSRYDF